MKDDIDVKILELSIAALTVAFDDFIGECLADNKPKAPSMGALMKARGYLPKTCKNSHNSTKQTQTKAG